MSVFKSQYLPNKTYATKEHMFEALLKNEELIIDFKKSLVHDGFTKGVPYGVLTNDIVETETTKGFGFKTKPNYIYPIVSTSRYMDNHEDVHFDGYARKTIKEQQGKIYYCADHNLTRDGIIASKSDVELMLKNVSWDMVGKNYEGTTEAIILAIDKANIMDEKSLKLIEKEKDLQNSVRMIYIKIAMGINSKEKEFAQHLAYWESRRSSIVNGEKADKLGYFFGVEELKLVGEASLVVAGGSNDATSIYQELEIKESNEADIITSTIIEPSQDTQITNNAQSKVQKLLSINNQKK
jgi:hypothetical protein